MPKSLSEIKKLVRGHIVALRGAASRIGTSVDVYTLYANRLTLIKKRDELEPWYRAFAKRVGAQIAQDPSEAGFMRDQLLQIETILGLRR